MATTPPQELPANVTQEEDDVSTPMQLTPLQELTSLFDDDDDEEEEEEEQKGNNEVVQFMDEITGEAKEQAAKEQEEITDMMDEIEKSAQSKLRSALNHLDYFLKRYANQKEETYVAATDIELCREPSLPTQKSPHWFNVMLGCFFKYLCQYAYQYLDAAKGRLSYGTASGYASSIKSFFEAKYRHNDNFWQE